MHPRLDMTKASPAAYKAVLALENYVQGSGLERRFIHPVLGKTVRRSKKYHAHDEKGQFKLGDIVRIQECRPLSKLKTWEVLDRVAK